MNGKGDQDTDNWGVEISGIHLKRHNSFGEVSFRLDIQDRVSIMAGPGQVNRLPVMGPSGAGKSTLLNLLSCTSFPQSPEAQVKWRFPDGVEIGWGSKGPGRVALVELRQKYFGYAFQTASLQPQLTMGENLTFGLENAGVPRKRAWEQAHNALSRAFDGDEERAANMMGRFDSEVSGGERQRVALLQSLMRDPYVLFADEPTGSLDKNTRRTVMTLLTDWLAEKPDERFFVWVTHHDHDPQDNGADTRLVVDEGHLRRQKLDGDTWTTTESPKPEEAV
ncbi:MAG: ATP-binding cassette domain-containing protein [Paracoccaceae bacterium]